MLMAGIASGEPGMREAGNPLGGERDHEAEDHEHRRDGPHRGRLPGQQALGGDQRGHQGHPRDAHHAEREQRGHQRPAAADADTAVLDAHPQRPEATPVPVAQEHRRAAAVAQAGVLRRGQLVEPGADDDAAGDVAPRVVPGEQAQIQRVQTVEDRVAEQARGRPCHEVTGHEQRVGGERGGPPRSPRAACSRAWATTIGATDGSIIAAIIVTHTTMNHPSPPRWVPGPASIRLMRSPVTAQAAPASTSSSPTRATWILVGSAGAR